MAKALLHQLLAMQGPKINTAEQMVNIAISAASSKDKVNGKTLSFEAFNADDKTIPQEVSGGTTRVQVRVPETLGSIPQYLADAWDIELSIAVGNQNASAPIMFEGKSLFNGPDGKPFAVPAPFLLFLENRLKGLLKQLQAVQVLDPAHAWDFDANTGIYKTEPTSKNKMEKVPQVLVLHAPTPNHPAQTTVINTDKPVGNIIAQFFTGAITAEQHRAMLERIQKLIDAVLAARYTANEFQAEQQKYNRTLLELIFEPVTKSQPATAAAT